MDIPRNQAQIFPCNFPSTPCDVFNCSKRAQYFVGRPDGPLNIVLRLCPDCLSTIAASMPESLSEAIAEKVKEFTPPEQYICVCGKEYETQPSLAAHQRSCKEYKESKKAGGDPDGE